jgi:hypothetical protein
MCLKVVFMRCYNIRYGKNKLERDRFETGAIVEWLDGDGTSGC